MCTQFTQFCSNLVCMTLMFRVLVGLQIKEMDPVGTPQGARRSVIWMPCDILLVQYILVICSEASLIRIINWFGHLFGNQFSFLNRKWLTYPEIQLYGQSGNEGVRISEAPLYMLNILLWLRLHILPLTKYCHTRYVLHLQSHSDYFYWDLLLNI